MDKVIIVSIISFVASCVTAVTAIGVAVWNYFANKKNAEGLEKLKSEIAEVSKEKDARRDYEYEARKRLYQECEPLLFQMREASEDALHRIFSIARTSKQGNLSVSNDNWLTTREYYLISSIYNLIVPLAIYRLLRRELTLVDFNMDLSIRYRYELCKKLYLSFTDDFSLADSLDKLPYDPFVHGWETIREKYPQKHWRQGIVIGKLEKAVEAIIVKNESNNKYRWMNYGEFETAFQKNSNDILNCIDVFVDLFKYFNPSKHPILWRIMVYQSYIYNAIIKASGDNPVFIGKHISFAELNDFELSKLDWVNPKEDFEIDWKEHISSVESYLEKTLKRVHQVATQMGQ